VAFGIAAAAALAYEWWARNRWRCSLRFLLGVFLLVSAALAWWWPSVSEGGRESRAVAPLHSKGFEIEWRCDAPVWLRILVGANNLRPFHHVVAITRNTDETVGKRADSKPITDTDVERVNELPYLKLLLLDRTRLTDAGLEHIKGLRELEVVYLDGTQVTDAGLEHIHDLPRLRYLDLDSTRITGVGFRHLKDLPRLQDLGLDNTDITDEALVHFKALPELRDLSLSGTKVTDAGMPHLKALTKLKIVHLDGTGVTDVGLRSLEGSRQLEKLQLNSTKVTGEGVKRLQRALPQCKIEWECEWKPPTLNERQGSAAFDQSGD
jgi:hypothetical protein